MSTEMSFDRALLEMLQDGPQHPSQSAVETALSQARLTRQRRGFVLAVAGPDMWPARRQSGTRWPCLRAALLVVLFIAALAGGAIGGAFLVRNVAPTVSPTPSSSIRPSPGPTRLDASATPVSVATLPAQPKVIEQSGIRNEHPGGPGAGYQLTPGHTYTSEVFAPKVTFTVPTSGQVSWCPVTTLQEQIAMPWDLHCKSDVEIMSPTAVDCGLPGGAASADAVAEAILAKDRVVPVDWTSQLTDATGSLQGLLADPRGARAVMTLGSARPLDPTAVDPDQCTITTDFGTYEVRGDIAALFVFADVNGQLVVVRSGHGYDGPSAQAVIDTGAVELPFQTAMTNVVFEAVQ